MVPFGTVEAFDGFLSCSVQFPVSMVKFFEKFTIPAPFVQFPLTNHWKLDLNLKQFPTQFEHHILPSCSGQLLVSLTKVLSSLRVPVRSVTRADALVAPEQFTAIRTPGSLNLTVGGKQASGPCGPEVASQRTSLNVGIGGGGATTLVMFTMTDAPVLLVIPSVEFWIAIKKMRYAP